MIALEEDERRKKREERKEKRELERKKEEEEEKIRLEQRLQKKQERLKEIENEQIKSDNLKPIEKRTGPSPRRKRLVEIGRDVVNSKIIEENDDLNKKGKKIDQKLIAKSLENVSLKEKTNKLEKKENPCFENNLKNEKIPITKKRIVTIVKPPESQKLTYDQVFCIDGTKYNHDGKFPDLELLMNHFFKEGLLAVECVIEILLQLRTSLLFENNVVKISSPVYIIGDIHGQYYDLVHLIKEIGIPGTTDHNVLFLGDYVDRGTFSCEVSLFLFACKLRYPKKVVLLRGNHETRAMTSYHNFKTEVIHKYGEDIYEMFLQVFDHLPLASIVNSRSLGNFFCCHGGLSPSFKTINDLQNLNRFIEPPEEGILCDIIWSDPVENDKIFNQNFSRNKERGCSFVFGYNPIFDFLETNNLLMIVRAHQVEERGYRELFFSQSPPDRKHPLLISLFSAPNYCDSYENSAAYMRLTHEEYTYHQYTWQEHPYCLPDFRNAFQLTLPSIAENLMNFLVNIVETINSIDFDESEDQSEIESEIEAKKTLNLKLKNLGKSFILIKKIREESLKNFEYSKNNLIENNSTKNTLEHIKGKMGGRKKIKRMVSDLSEMVKASHDRFESKKKEDQQNEKYHGIGHFKSSFRKLERGTTFRV